MLGLNKRVAALEQASPSTNTGPMFIHLAALDAQDSEIQRIAKGGQEWTRQPDESEQDLKDRARQEVTPPQPGCSTVFLCY